MLDLLIEDGAVIGREPELTAAAEFLDPASTLPAALIVAGEPGIGKTSIVGNVLAGASAAGLRVRLASPAEGEADLPYSGLADLLSGLDDAFLAELPGPQRSAVDAALARGAAGSPVERHALARGLLELLKLEGASGDLLLAVDDVQWLDRPTRAALDFVLRRLGTLPVRLLVAMRTGGDVDDIPFSLPGWNTRRLDVGPLDPTALGTVIRTRLGVQIARPRLEALWHTCGGNPMFALELVRHDGFDPAARPTLPRTIQDRLRTLDPQAQTAVAVAAAALRPSISMMAAAGVERAGIEAARAAGVITVDEDWVSFSHPLLASAAYELPLPDERRKIHARLATASGDAIERGHHIASSAVARDEEAAELLDVAAAEAAALGDHATAATFLLRSSDLSADPGGETAVWREVKASRELTRAGDIEAAAVICRRLIDRLPPGIPRARALQTLSWCIVGSELSYAEARAMLEEAIEDAKGDAIAQAEMLLEMAEISQGMCRLEDGLDYAVKARRLAESSGAPVLAMHALASAGFAESMLFGGVPAGLRTAYELWDGTPTWTNSPRMILACACIPAGRFDEAQELLEQEIAWSREHGLEEYEIVAQAHLAETQVRAGLWEDGLVNARRALEHARQAAEPQIINGVCYAVGMLESSFGHHEGARAIAVPAVAGADATGDFWFMVSHRAVLGQVDLAEGNAEAAIETLEPAWRLMLNRGLGDLSLFPIAQNLGEAYAATGRPDDARSVAASLRACPVGQKPWCRAMAARIEAHVASIGGDHESARAGFAAALEALDDWPEPFEYARTLELAGEAERRARNWGAAREMLVNALARFDQLGAARWVQVAEADIARIGGRRPAGHELLTGREQEVAAMAVQGFANKEIAAQLHISVRTVEANLSKVYGKIGVRSRTELAARLAR